MREMLRRLAMFICNYAIAFSPCWHLRRAYYHYVLRHAIGKMSRIDMRAYFLGPGFFSIGDYSHVNQGCLIDTRGGVSIGNSVSISHRVMIFTGSHDVHTQNFKGLFKPVEIEDYVFVGPGVIILQGVKIGRGAVVAAGSVVTKDVESCTIVGGVPARCLGRREGNLSYHCISKVKFQ